MLNLHVFYQNQNQNQKINLVQKKNQKLRTKQKTTIQILIINPIQKYQRV